MYLQHVIQNDYPHNETVLEVPCPSCGKVSEITIPTNEWLDGLKAYKNGAVVQNAWPKLSPSQRELLITGICETCWNEMFA